jgi:hypothetical protein
VRQKKIAVRVIALIKKEHHFKMSEEEDIEQSTDGGQLAIEENLQKQNAESETPGAAKSITINKEPITNMEVHHHPHVEKKNFKEYFGILSDISRSDTGLFCREFERTYSRKEREKVYIKDLYEDLKSDNMFGHTCNG